MSLMFHDRSAVCGHLSQSDVFNMYEYFNANSPWNAFLCTLLRSLLPTLFVTMSPCTIPSSFTTTLYWSPRDVEAAIALNPQVKKFTDSHKIQMASHYTRFVVPLTKSHPFHFPASLFNFQNFVWAATACRSRSWEINSGEGTTFIMVPVLDLVNHRHPGNHVSYDRAARKFSLIAGPEGVEKGAEGFLSYGAKCNALLLATYGFAVAQNTVDCKPVVIP